MTTSEKSITDKIIARLRSEGFWVLKVHGGGYQTAGLPDLLACREGKLWAFEVKRPGGHVSRLQRKRLDELAAAGASVAVITSVEELVLVITRDEP